MSDDIYREEQEKEQEQRVKEAVLRSYLTPKARSRLTNVSLVKPDLASSIEDMIVSLATSGKLDRPIDEDELKQVLYKAQQSRKKQFRIRRR
jgi:programmed cell death protein 5